MAAGRSRTFSPMTMVPVRSLTTTLALTSASTSTASSLASRVTGSSLLASGTLSSTAAESRALALGVPRALSMAAEMRIALVKSGRFSLSTSVPVVRLGVTARSTVAPAGMLPAVGVFFLIAAATPLTSKPPTCTGPWATA